MLLLVFYNFFVFHLGTPFSFEINKYFIVDGHLAESINETQFSLVHVANNKNLFKP